VADSYELKPAPRRSESEEVATRRARRLQRRFLRYSRQGKVRPRRPQLHRFSQRSTVKVSYRRNEGNGKWRAHGRYIARENGRPDPENRGLGFDAEREDVRVARTLAAWEKAGDTRVWKLMVSPENGDRMNLRRHARGLMDRLGAELGTKLTWVAVEHDHNGHPHLHIALRGQRQDGAELRIPRDTIRHGIRHYSQALATRELGARTVRDIERAREAGVDARYVGALDLEIERRVDAHRSVGFRREPAAGSPRHLLWRRLEHLESLGVVFREGAHRWRVPADFRADLRVLQRLEDIHRALHDAAVSLSQPLRRVVITELQPGQVLIGRVAGAVHDAATDQVHLILEDPDGVVHAVRQTPQLERERAEGRLRKGTIATLEGRVFDVGGRPRNWVLARDHGTLEHLRAEARPTTPLDWEALRRVWAHGTMDLERPAASAFGRQWDGAVHERAEALIRAGLLLEGEREQGRAVRLSRKMEAMMEDRGRERMLLNLEEVQKHSEKPVRPAPDVPGQRLSGRLEAVAYDRENHRHAILDTGRELTTIRTDQNDLQVGHEYEAAASRTERGEERRRLVAWQLDDLERAREHDRGHG
jgi:type IV secretory pathway VirD2 relaxase